ncbi:MAG: DUF4238 domain-containing protein [Planctomycetes bacterium]|nr:DUF4238 domain-containing protein [Planctomycetota bacterium]
MSQEKINHHYVPASYLKGYTIDGENSLIWGYDKKYGKCTGKRSVDNICSEDYYYEQPTPDGSTTQMFEDAFNDVEKAGIEIVKKLNPKYDLSESDKGTLAFYVALLLTRGPSFRDGCHSALKHQVDIMTQNEYKMGRLPEPPEIIKKLIKNNDITSVIKTKILPHVSLRYMIDGAIQMSESLCNKKWILFFLEKDYYVTSDTPVLFGQMHDNSQETGPSSPQSWVICPLNKKIALVARPYCRSDNSAFEFKEAEKGFVELVNEQECFSSQRFVYSPVQSEKLLEQIISAKGNKQRLRAYRVGDSVIHKWGIDKD